MLSGVFEPSRCRAELQRLEHPLKAAKEAKANAVSNAKTQENNFKCRQSHLNENANNIQDEFVHRYNKGAALGAPAEGREGGRGERGEQREARARGSAEAPAGPALRDGRALRRAGRCARQDS